MASIKQDAFGRIVRVAEKPKPEPKPEVKKPATKGETDAVGDK